MRRELENAGVRIGEAQGLANPPTKNSVRYSLKEGAAAEIANVLNDISIEGDIKLTESTPSIILSHKVTHNYPMVMSAKHIRENILTVDEANAKGLSIDSRIHYHGLGDTLFLKVIEDLDNVTLAYRGTKNAKNLSRRENYFVLVSKHTNSDGETIIVPVYINQKSGVNQIYVDVNKIATVFGKLEIDEYLEREVRNKNLVRIKKQQTQ